LKRNTRHFYKEWRVTPRSLKADYYNAKMYAIMGDMRRRLCLTLSAMHMLSAYATMFNE